MSARRARLALRPLAMTLAACLIGGCGATTSTGRTATGAAANASGPVTRTQALTYAHAVNLRERDVPGFSANGTEAQAPTPGPAGPEFARCTHALDPRRRIAAIESPTLEAGRARTSRFLRSTVEVWPTHADVLFNSSKSHTAHARACLKRVAEAVRARVNRTRRGAIGPSKIGGAPISIPGLEPSYLTSIDETRLRRSGAVLIHIYRDLFAFTSGPAEVELEAVGFSHPVAPSTEKQALEILVARAHANAGSWR